MKILLKILNLYINSSVHVAIAVASFTGLTYLDLGLDLQYYSISFVFFSTIFAYTFVKYLPFVWQNFKPLNNTIKGFYLLALFSVVPAVISLYQFSLQAFVFTSGLGVLTLLYALPFLPSAKNLRDISGLKIFIISLVWTGATVILPLFTSEFEWSSLTYTELLYTGSRFLIVTALIIPFEIRDLKLDHIYLKTLPQVLGVFWSKVLAISFTLMSMFLLSSIDIYIEVDSIFHIIIIIMILGAKSRNSFYYASFWVESIPVLWFLSKIV